MILYVSECLKIERESYNKRGPKIEPRGTLELARELLDVLQAMNSCRGVGTTTLCLLDSYVARS